MSETVSWADRVRGRGMGGRYRTGDKVLGVCVRGGRCGGGEGGVVVVGGGGHTGFTCFRGGKWTLPSSSSEDTQGDAVRSRAEDQLL